MDYDGLIYFLITTIRAVALGLAVTIALDVLPGSRRARLTVHWAVVWTWVAAVLWTHLAFHFDTRLIGWRPRISNTLVELYFLALLALHIHKGPWVPGPPECRASWWCRLLGRRSCSCEESSAQRPRGGPRRRH